MVTNFFRRYINTSKAYRLEKLVDRSLLRLCGHDCVSFLQGLVTNDVTRLQSGKSMFALFLNNRGRVLYDLLLYKDDNDILLECDTCSKQGLLKHLRMYRLRKKVDFYEINDHVWVAYNTADACLGKLQGIQFLDPRSAELGWRVYAQDGYLQQNCEVGYCRLRYKLGIAEGSFEYGNTMPLEMNCDYLNGVSFDKGCYIGQELTARTHHTGVVRKRLMPLILKESDGSAVTDLPVVTAVGQVVGKVRAQTGDHAIALMRVSEALENADTLRVGQTPATTYRPHWWPQPNRQHVSA